MFINHLCISPNPLYYVTHVTNVVIAAASMIIDQMLTKMKTILIPIWLMMLAFTACEDPWEEINVPKEYQTTQPGSDVPLSDAEKSAILFMREEEKLARDVYDYLYAKWGQRIFDNISSSEQQHMDAVLRLINQFGLEDPAKHQAAGIFVNQDLQSMYNELIGKGSTSWEEALRVGAAIEEMDIMDLQQQLEDNIEHPDIVLVFENLLKGSQSHLRAFVRNLEMAGVIYTPQYLSSDTYKLFM